MEPNWLPVRLIVMTVNTLGEPTVGPQVSARGTTSLSPEIESIAQARSATIRALQQVFETLDGRRPADHLQRCVTDGVYAQLAILLRRRVEAGATAAPESEATRLVRVHLQAGVPRRAEFFGTFTRGTRVRAVAGRVEIRRVMVSERGRPRRLRERWILVELSIL